MKRFKISDAQAEAILELKLRHLAKLEEMQIRGEQKALSEERADLEQTLKSKAKLTKLIKTELAELAEKHGDKRRTVDRRARGRASDRRVGARHERARHGRALGARLRARREGSRHRRHRLVVQVGRPVPFGRARQEQSARGVHRQHGPRLQRRRAHVAVGARPRRAAVGLFQSARRRELPRRADRRARGQMGRRVVGGLRLRREARGALREQEGRQDGAARARRRDRRARVTGRRGRRAARGRIERRPAARVPARGAARAQQGQGQQDSRGAEQGRRRARGRMRARAGARVAHRLGHAAHGDQGRGSRALCGRARPARHGVAARLANGGSGSAPSCASGRRPRARPRARGRSGLACRRRRAGTARPSCWRLRRVPR